MSAVPATASKAPARRVPFYRGLRFREGIYGWVFALPAILGLLVFTAGPILVSLYLSLTQYNVVAPPTFVGLANYQQLFTDDPLFRQSLAITAYYSVLAIPLGLASAFLVAVLLNQDVRGIAWYRAIWYLPSLVPAVATATLWRWMLNSEFGLINWPLKSAGLPAPGWLVDPRWTIPSLVLIHIWGVGNAMLIFLAGLQGVPQHLLEAAEIDGASWWSKFWHVTVPMVSPIIFFNLILGIIGAFQVFTIAYVIFTPTGGTGTAGPDNAALFYVLYLYRNAFQYFKMGYASAMAWVLFLIIMALTWVSFRFQQRRVYYEGGQARR